MADDRLVLELQARLARLERARRRERVAALAALLVLPLLAFVPGRRSGDEVRATRFVVVTEDGREAGRFVAGKDGYPTLELLDETGRTRVQASVSTDDATILLRDRKGLSRVGQSVDVAGMPHVLLSDTGGRPRLHVSVNAKDRGNLILFGPEGSVVAGIGVQDDGAPWLRPATASNAAAQAGGKDGEAGKDGGPRK